MPIIAYSYRNSCVSISRAFAAISVVIILLRARSSSWTSVHKSRTVHVRNIVVCFFILSYCLKQSVQIILSLGLILNAIVDAILMSLFTLYLHKCRTDFKKCVASSFRDGNLSSPPPTAHNTWSTN